MIKSLMLILSLRGVRLKPVVISLAVLLGVFVVVFAFRPMDTRRGRVDARLVDELRRQEQTLELIKQNMVGIVEDNAEVRAALGLPQREYRLSESPGPPGTVHDSGGDATAFFRAAERLVEHLDTVTVTRVLTTLFDSPELVASLEAEDLEVTHSGPSAEIVHQGVPVIHVSAKSDMIEWRPITGTAETTTRDVNEATTFIRRVAPALRRHATRLASRSQTVESIPALATISRAAAEAGVTFAQVHTTRAGTFRSVHAGSRLLFETGVDARTGEYHVGSETADDTDEYVEMLLARIRSADTRSAAEIARDRAVAEAEKVFADESFQAFLRDRGITIATEPTFSQRYILYKLRSNGSAVGAFGIRRDTGELWLLDEDELPIASFTALGVSLSEPARIPATVRVPGARNFLLVGTHEGLADSIMIARADPSVEEISVLSIPRDVYVRGRKLNAVYSAYGADRFADEITEIVGLEIDNYIVIDMMAFAEVIDILGGVEVTLTEDLVDPLYRTKDHGEWGTLYLPRGTHNVNGLQALRVARSRTLGSDFERSRRQHIILEGILLRLGDLGSAGVRRMYDLAHVFHRRVQTNLSPAQMVQYFFAYRDMPLANRTVIDTTNVLYATYSNLYYSGRSKDDVADHALGAWILLPESNDWNVVRRFVRNWISGERT